MKKKSALVWNVQQTRDLVGALHGPETLASASRSLSSTLERREYARYHYGQLRQRWIKLKKDASTPAQHWNLIVNNEINGKDQYAAIHSIAANTVACLQSLHSIPDILAHALYHSLGGDKTAKLKERAITATSVRQFLESSSTHSGCAKYLDDAMQGGDFKTLAAITNHSKHRSVVRNSISMDATGADPEPLRLLFESFQYGTEHFTGRDVLPFLEAEFNRLSKLLVEVGIELNKVLESDLSAHGGRLQSC